MKDRHPDNGPCILHLRGTSLSGSLDFIEAGRVSMIVQARPSAGVTFCLNEGSVIKANGILDKFRSLGGGEYEVVLTLDDVQPWLGHVRDLAGDDGPKAA